MTDSTIALIERLKDPWQHTEELCFEAATELTTLLQRCETFERQYRQVSQDHAEMRRQRDEALKAVEALTELLEIGIINPTGSARLEKAIQRARRLAAELR